MFCGREDLLVSPEDYTWLRDELMEGGNVSYFKEYDLGHMGVIIPKDRTPLYDMLAVAKHFNEKDGKVLTIGSDIAEKLEQSEQEMATILASYQRQ
mmetsp:Transcript_29274/g.38984  ORF Transcript_29274/g.38984 Transcript_29274/m.38984 type:complete len:96 (+) Transcript_29274:947-1234(+)